MNDTWWVKPEQLDGDQKKVVELPEHGSYLVCGPPGSGKTNLLLLRANYMVRSGKPNVLILVFTKTLQQFMATGSETYAFSNDKIMTCTAWELQLLNEYGITPLTDKKFDVQRMNLISQVKYLIESENISDIYDVILLDEAQDYLKEEIEVFDKLAKNIFAVADNRQKIYAGDGVIDLLATIVDNSIPLKYHYRNGHMICRLAEETIKKNTVDYKFLSSKSNYDEAAKPSTVNLIKCADLDEQCEKIIDSLKVQIIAYPDELLGVLCPRHAELELVWDKIASSDLADYAILQSGHNGYAPFEAGKRICVCTIHSAKGLEFRTLHVAGCDYLKKFKLSRNMIFTAITRSKTTYHAYYSETILGYIESAFAALTPPPVKPKLSDLFSGGK